MGNHSLRVRLKLDRPPGIKLQDTGEQLSGSPHAFLTDALQCGDESFRIQRREKWEFVWDYFSNQSNIWASSHSLIDGWFSSPTNLRVGFFTIAFLESQNDTYHFSLHSKSIIEIHTVYVSVHWLLWPWNHASFPTQQGSLTLWFRTEGKAHSQGGLKHVGWREDIKSWLSPSGLFLNPKTLCKHTGTWAGRTHRKTHTHTPTSFPEYRSPTHSLEIIDFFKTYTTQKLVHRRS